MTKQQTCKERISKEWEQTKKGWLRADKKNELSEYGLAFDYVPAHTFTDQKSGYLRYQFSWGGPSDELRIYRSGKIEYWFMDWYDGAKKIVTNDPTARLMAKYAQENRGMGCN